MNDDLSKLSDEELEKIASGADDDMESMSDEELEKIASGPEEKPMWRQVVDYGDKFTAAPTRAAFDAALQGKNPLQAFASQFGEDPDLAPSGKQSLARQGVPTTSLIDRLAAQGIESDEVDPNTGRAYMAGALSDVSPAGLGGFALDLALDPTNLTGVGALAKGGANIGIGGARMAAEGAANAAKAGIKGAQALEKGVIGTNALKSVVEGTGAGAKQLGGFLEKFVSPKRSAQYDELSRIAKELGIDPTLLSENAEFGPQSFIARQARGIREGVTGEKGLEQFEKGRQAIELATEGQLEKIGKGKVMDKAVAGDALAKSYDKGVKSVFDGLDLTNAKIMERVPEMPLTEQAQATLMAKLRAKEDAARKLLEKGYGDEVAEAKSTLEAIESIKASNKTFDDMYFRGSSIGRAGFKSGPSQVPADKKALQDIYFDVQEAIQDTVKTNLGEGAYNALKESNEKISQLKKYQKLVDGVIKGKGSAAPESVVNRLFSDSRKIEAMKKIVDPQAFDALKASWFNENILKRNADGDMLFGSSKKALQKNRALVEAMFTPDELKRLEQSLDLGLAQGEETFSSSRTSAAENFAKLMKAFTSESANQRLNEALKARARGLSTPKPPSSTPAQQIGQGFGQLVSGVQNNPARLVGANDQGFRRSKVLQMLSPQLKNYEQEQLDAGQTKPVLDNYVSPNEAAKAFAGK